MADKKYAAGDIFTLREPIEKADGSGRIHNVTFSRPKGRALRELASIPEEETWALGCAMVRHITGLSEQDLDEMDAEDLVEIVEAAGDFFEMKASSKGTSPDGEASSPTAPQS